MKILYFVQETHHVIILNYELLVDSVLLGYWDRQVAKEHDST